MDVFLAFRGRSLVRGSYVRPMVTIVTIQEVLVRSSAFCVFRWVPVRATSVLVVCSILVDRRRLAAASAYAGIARPVIVTCLFILVVEVDLANLNNVRRGLFLNVLVQAGRNAATANHCRLVPIRTRSAVHARHAARLSIGHATGSFNNIFGCQGVVLSDCKRGLIGLAKRAVGVS